MIKQKIKLWTDSFGVCFYGVIFLSCFMVASVRRLVVAHKIIALRQKFNYLCLKCSCSVQSAPAAFVQLFF